MLVFSRYPFAMVHRVKGIVSRSSAVALFDIRYVDRMISKRGPPHTLLLSDQYGRLTCRVGTNEKDVIVLTPSDMETAPTLVQGRVVLSLSDSLSVRSINLRMYGVASVA